MTPTNKKAILIGLIGTGIQGSAGPELQMTEGEQQGIRYIYRLIDLTLLHLGPEALPDLLLAAERTGFNGLAITHPANRPLSRI
jgi:shikimate dehydrogenase